MVSVRRGFLFLWALGIGYVILLWHTLGLPYNYFGVTLFCPLWVKLSFAIAKPILWEIEVCVCVCGGGGGGWGPDPLFPGMMNGRTDRRADIIADGNWMVPLLIS